MGTIFIAASSGNGNVYYGWQGNGPEGSSIDWSAPDNRLHQLGGSGYQFGSVGCAELNGVVHVVATSGNGGLWHASAAAGSSDAFNWSGWAPVDINNYGTCACAAYDGTLYALATSPKGVWMYSWNGSWSDTQPPLLGDARDGCSLAVTSKGLKAYTTGYGDIWINEPVSGLPSAAKSNFSNGLSNGDNIHGVSAQDGLLVASNGSLLAATTDPPAGFFSETAPQSSWPKSQPGGISLPPSPQAEETPDGVGSCALLTTETPTIGGLCTFFTTGDGTLWFAGTEQMGMQRYTDPQTHSTEWYSRTWAYKIEQNGYGRVAACEF
jgi:hypothetical protein